MNKIYKVVWSKVKHCYVVTSELAKRQTKGCGARSLRMATVSLGVAASLLCSGAVLPVFGESVAEAGSVGVVNKLIMGDGLEWNGSTTAVTITADTIDTINNNINADPRKHAYGNITYTYGSEKFNAIAERDVVSFKVVDGQLIECHDAPITVIQQYPSAMDGYDTNKDVSGYSITINNTSDKLLYAVYGGYSKEGNVSSNSATITNGTITNTVYGGYSGVSGNVENNNVIINGGTIGDLDNGSGAVYGAYTYNGLASNNTITINSGSTVRCPTAGSSYNGKVEENTLNINGGTIVEMAFGGVGNGTYVKSNTVNIKNDATVNATVYGGMVWGDSASDPTDVTGNTVNISDTANVNENVYGGYTYYGKVSNNTVNLNGGTAYKVYGGYTISGAAETNHVVMNGGVVGITTTGGKTVFSGGQLYGAYSYNSSGNSGNVTGNTVTINEGIVMSDIYGGSTKAEDTSNQSGVATKNNVTINDGTLAGRDIYGGYSGAQYKTSGNVEGNQVIIKGGVLKSASVTINGINLNTDGVRYIRGGYTYGYDKDTETGASGIAKDNVVTISGGALRSDVKVTGGESNANNAEHNMVNIESTFTGMVGEVTGGEAGGNGTAKKNEVTISGGTVRDSNDSGVHVFGGKASTGSAIENKVTINKNATVNSHVDGGYTTAGTAENNEVTIDGGNVNGVVNGGSISYEGDTTPGAVTGNTVTIKNGSKVGSQNASGIYGGYVAGGRSYGDLTNAGDVTGNKVFIMGGEVYDVYGGLSELGTVTLGSKTCNSGDVTKNEVEISGGTVSGGVYGGWTNNGTAGGSEDAGNKVTVSGTAITYYAYGGYSQSGTASYNTVDVENSEYLRNAFGGYSDSGSASYNRATVNGGDVGGLYGAEVFQGSGDVTNNKAELKSGAVIGYLFGGYIESGTGKATDNEVEITGGTMSQHGYGHVLAGGRTRGGDALDNTVTIQAGEIGKWNGYDKTSLQVAGGYVEGYAGNATGNSVNISGGIFGGAYEMDTDSGVEKGELGIVVYGGYTKGETNDIIASKNMVTISKDAKLTGAATIIGGASGQYYGSVSGADDNTVTISGGTIGTGDQDSNIYGGLGGGTASGNTVTIKEKAELNKNTNVYGGKAAVYYEVIKDGQWGYEEELSGTASDNTVNIEKAVTVKGLYGGAGDTTKSTGNTLNVKATGVKADEVKYFQTVALHGLTWDTPTAVLEGTTLDGVKTLDIKNLKFDKTPANGESMALLKSDSDLGASGVGVGLAYKDGNTEKTATSAQLVTGVTFDSDALADTAVNGVSLTGTQSKKVSLENSNHEIRYAFSSTISGITIATDTFTSGGTARAFGSGDNLTGATITNNLAFTTDSKKNMESGQSMVILDAMNAVAVEGATLPAFTSASYDVNFSDAIDGKVVTFAGKHTDTLALNSAKNQMVYTVGDKNVETVTLDGTVEWGSEGYQNDNSKYKFSNATEIDATKLKVTGKTTEALTKGSGMTLLSASGLTAGTVTQPTDPGTVTVNYTNTEGIVFSGDAKGEVKAGSGSVDYKVTGVTLTSVGLGDWKGTESSMAASGIGDWTVTDSSQVKVTTGDMAKAGLDKLNPGDIKIVLTAVDSVDFSKADISGSKAWKDGGDFDEGTHESGVSVKGSTTGGGVKADDTSKNVLVYQKDKSTVTGVTLGAVKYDTSKSVRTFDNSYDLTGATIDASGFSLSNLKDVKATMNAGDTMVVVDATKAIKGSGDATLKEFTKQNAGAAIAFADKIDSTALTFAGTHQDTLEQDDAKTQILYKVGDKNVNAVTFNGEVTWNESKAYYTNDATKYKFNGATDIDATNLKVTGTATTALKNGASMTLLSAQGMTAGTVTPQSDANKTASKIAVNYSDTASGIAFGATATGAVEATDNAVNYKVDTVTLNSVDLAGWNGTTSSVPGGWTIGDGATINTDGLAAPAVEPGSHVDILQNDTDNYFASATISGANTYQSTDFKDEMNGVTLEGKQDKGVTLNSEKKHLIYAAGTKNTASVSFGTVEWQKDATLADAAAGYDFTKVAEIGTENFAMTYAKPEDVAVNDSMTLLKANETLTEMAGQTKKLSYNYMPVAGVTLEGDITGALKSSGGAVTCTATANQASKLTFGDVEWKDSGALMARPANITFSGADVDTAKINFHNIQELAANSRMTLVSDFGETVGTITGDTFTVGSGLKGEGAASLSGTDLVFTAKTGAESLTPTEATHETVMAMEAGTAVVAAGREYVDSAVEGLGLVSNMAPDGTSTFASMGGGVGRYKTGSHVDMHTWNAVVAVGSKREHKKGSLEWGVFAEYGRGNYTLHDDNGGRGDGNTHYAGGGLLAKWTNKHDVYTEASFRMGRMSDSASNMLRDVLGNTYGYDVHANYFGGHVGLGKIYKVKGNKDLDVYGKFFYTRRNGVDFDAGGNHYSLDSVASKLLRIGARYGSNDRKWNWYGGLAYEYEFGGESKGTVDGLAIRSASIKGGSVRGEIGMRMEATKTNPWKADISIYGYGGKHRGFGGNVSVAYMF